ncbi:hypothetical protein EUBC25_22540 [Claveliimonas bilis]|nr:hypothetical protein EUBC25_22540 [Claveliimonas bilis]
MIINSSNKSIKIYKNKKKVEYNDDTGKSFRNA